MGNKWLKHVLSSICLSQEGVCVQQQGASASAAVLSLGVGVEEKTQQEGARMLHMTHPDYAWFESMPSKLVFVVDVFESKSFVC